MNQNRQKYLDSLLARGRLSGTAHERIFKHTFAAALDKNWPGGVNWILRGGPPSLWFFVSTCAERAAEQLWFAPKKPSKRRSKHAPPTSKHPASIAAVKVRQGR